METEYTIKIKLNEWQALEALCKALNCEAVLDPDKELKIEKGYVWIKEKTPTFFLAGALMFVFAALGPATGNSDLIFLISMFGKLRIPQRK